MKIGFIGLGRMGHHVAANLLKAGHQVTVWNRSQSPVQALVAKGAIAAKTPEDAVQGDAVFSMLSNDAGDARGRAGRAAAGKSRQGPDPCESGDHLGGVRQGTGRRRTKRPGLAYISAPVFGRPEMAEAAAAGAGGRRRRGAR